MWQIIGMILQAGFLEFIKSSENLILRAFVRFVCYISFPLLALRLDVDKQTSNEAKNKYVE